MKNNCPSASDAMAFVTGDLTPEETMAFSGHLMSCPCCRLAEEEARRIHGQLLRLPERDPEPDAAARILAALHAHDGLHASASPTPSAFRWSGYFRWAAAAAAILLGLVSLPWMDSTRQATVGQTTEAPPIRESDESLARALTWFVQSQEADGSWDATRWGGSRQFQVALTALPAIALMKSAESGPGHREAAERAIAWLVARQSSDGLIGEDVQGSPYNHTIATFALLHAYEQRPSDGLRAALDRALAAITFRQLRDGAWGYAASRRGDHSITGWTTETLDYARRIGWPELGPRLERSRAWLASHPRGADDDPAISPGTRLAIPAGLATGPDMDAAYFQVIDWQRDASTTARARHRELCRELARHQSDDGIQSGSWPPTDRWGRAGGRLYATALASMMLAETL